MDTALQKFLEDLMAESSQLLQKYSGQIETTVKPEDNNQVLTRADIENGAFLVNAVKNCYPEWNIIDEEAGIIDNGSTMTAVIDPIDGTSNFANGLPHFGVMVGVLDGGIPVAGAVCLPGFGTTYVALHGKGAWCNGQRISVGSERLLKNALVAYGIDGHPEDPERTKDESDILRKLVLNIRNLRSSNSVFDLMAVADGRYGANLNQTSKIWDNVAPQVIITEAGGTYTDFWGKPLDYSNPLSKAALNFTVCAAAPSLHQQIQDLLRR